MVKEHKEDRAQYLQGLVDSFIWVESLLEPIVTGAKQLLHWQKQFGFAFNFDKRSGELLSIETNSSEVTFPEYIQMVEDHKLFCREDGELAVRWLKELQEQVYALDLALAQLPDEIHQMLSDVRRRRWRPYVRRYVVLHLTRWPRLPSRESWALNRTVHPARAPAPDRLDRLLDYTVETDPTEEWQRICRRIQSFLDDIRVVALEIKVDVKEELITHSGRHKSPSCPKCGKKVKQDRGPKKIGNSLVRAYTCKSCSNKFKKAELIAHV